MAVNSKKPNDYFQYFSLSLRGYGHQFNFFSNIKKKGKILYDFEVFEAARRST